MRRVKVCFVVLSSAKAEALAVWLPRSMPWIAPSARTATRSGLQGPGDGLIMNQYIVIFYLPTQATPTAMALPAVQLLAPKD